jgi:arylsulfatase A-like enzyme
MGPHVLLVVWDAARRDALEPYGAPAGATPTIAQLASRGAAHRDVYATACWTVPSHSSIFTGLMPRAAGLTQVRSPAEARPRVQSHRDRMLPEVLGRFGYRSIGVSANLWVSPASGFDTGFERFELVDSSRHGRMHLEGRRERLKWVWEGARGRADDGAEAVENVLRGALGGSDKPFFCFVNLLECHSPYLPPRPYGGLSFLERARAAEDARRYYTLDSIWRTNAGAALVPEPVFERARRVYAAAIRYMDDWLGRVLEHLDASRLLDDTLVIVTSDHGENFGEGGRVSHALSLDNRLIHVPFVAAGPGHDQGLSSLASLPRFVTEAAGIDGHPYRDEPPAGYGVAQFDPPMERDDQEMVDTIRSAGLADAIEIFSTPLTCAVADGMKLLQRDDREELYDLERDPLEQEPLEPEAVSPERIAGLRSALDHPSMIARGGDTPVDKSAAGEISDEEKSKIEEQMKLLGYL